jgi:hypothetical protein
VDITTAIVDTIQALAWPAAVLGSVWVVRREIRALLKRVSGIKYKDLEIAIGEELGMAREALPAKVREKSLPLLEVKEEKNEVAELMALGARSPRDAIMESWSRLQSVFVGIARGKGHDFLSASVNLPYALNAVVFLLNQKLIPNSIAAAIQHLGAIHSKISDNPEFQPTLSKAQEFILYSLSVREALKKIE